jgi:hypothetical protein
MAATAIVGVDPGRRTPWLGIGLAVVVALALVGFGL